MNYKLPPNYLHYLIIIHFSTTLIIQEKCDHLKKIIISFLCPVTEPEEKIIILEEDRKNEDRKNGRLTVSEAEAISDLARGSSVSTASYLRTFILLLLALPNSVPIFFIFCLPSLVFFLILFYYQYPLFSFFLSFFL